MLLCLNFVLAIDPEGPGFLNITSNETKETQSSEVVNISGGYIATINITTTVQNPRWKAFVGDVSGSFTLDDSSGSTIYDWTSTVTSGRIYATRDSGSIEWSSVNCSNTTQLEAENTAMSHNNTYDNITATFSDTTHNPFWVGGVSIGQNECPTLNTYVDNSTQDTDFEEMALYDGTSIIYATILENDADGFDENNYDFQMIVPENGANGFSGATAYYIYVEVN